MRAAPSPIGGAAAAGCLAAALWGLPVLALSANRLVPGDPVYAADASGPAILAALGLACFAGLILWAGRGRPAAAAAALLLAAAAAAFLAGLGATAADLLAGRPTAARAGLASGAWIGLFAIATALALSLRRAGAGRPGLLVFGTLAALVLAAGSAGLLDHLSLAVEFRARRAGLIEALAEHLLLAGGALALAAATVLLLAPWRSLRGSVDLVASGLQVVPAVALLAALTALVSAVLKAMPGLREAGLSALGPVPALVAVAAYLLLPLWRGLAAARRAPGPAVLDAATALGLSARETLVQVRLPIGAPALIGGVRVAAVQAVGLSTLGALVGAGGLGRIVFDGMAQFAPDLILLGALPVIGLSLLAEGLLGGLEDGLRR